MHDPFIRLLAVIGVGLALLAVAYLVFVPPPASAAGMPHVHVDRQNSGRVQ